MKTSESGFTLLEVLLAGFILFLVLSSMTMVYRGALLSSSKAELSIDITGSVPFIRVIVTDVLREGKSTEDQWGEGEYGDLAYHWVAQLTHEGQPSPILQETAGDLRYYLWHIELVVMRGHKERRYEFSEISW